MSQSISTYRWKIRLRIPTIFGHGISGCDRWNSGEI
jgi:hypothetical protein